LRSSSALPSFPTRRSSDLFWGRPQGTTGPPSVDGKQFAELNPDLASHTFAIPELGVSVPLKGVADNAKNQCSVAPCTLSEAHTTDRKSTRLNSSHQIISYA